MDSRVQQNPEDLVAGEAALRAIFNSVNDAIFIHDVDTGRVLDVNETACRMYKCARDQLIDSDPTQFSLGEPPYSLVEAKQWLAKASAGEPQVFEWRARDKQGGLFWVEVSVRRAAIGPSDRLVVTVRDVTDRKNAQQELKDKEHTMSLILDSISEHFIYQTPDHRILWANKAAAESVGRTPEELKGRLCYTLWGNQEGECEYCPFQEIMQTGKSCEKEITSPDGRSWNIRGYPVLSPQGKIEALIEVTTEITERRRTEQALQLSEEKYKALIETTDTGFLIVDLKGRVIDANAEYVRLTGRKTQQEILGRSFLEWTAPHELARNAQAFDKCLREGYIRNLEIDYVGPDGRLFPIELNATALGVGESIRIMCLCRDIAERKRMQAETKVEELRLQALLRFSQFNPASVHDLLDLALDEIVKLSESQYGYIFHYGEDTQLLTVHAWSKAVMRECAIHHPPEVYELDKTGIWGEPVRQRKPIVVNDFAAANPLKKGHPEGHVKLRRFMTIPVFSDGRIVGVAGVANKSSDYTDGDVHRLTIMMDFVWRTIQRKYAEEALRQSEEKFSKAFHASPAVMVISSFEDKRILEVNEAFEMTAGYKREEAIGRTIFDLHLFADVQEMADLTRLIETKGGAHNVECRFLNKAGAVLTGLVSIERIDMAGQSCVVSTIVDVTERRRLFEQLQQINAQLEQRVHERTAVAEERAAQLRLLASRLTMAEHRERRRIAHVLHEHFQQLLASAKINLGVVRRKTQDTAIFEPLRRVEDAIDESIRSSRSLTVELCPPILYDMGLAATMEWLGRWMQDKYHLKVDVQADPSANPQAEDINILLFHSARELLFNVVKHADVSQATLHMTRKDADHVEILVADDGHGFDPAAWTPGADVGGFGLFSIRERLQLVGGSFDIRSHEKQGTQVWMVAPLRGEPADDAQPE